MGADAKAGQYRERAAELRAVAAWMKNPGAMLATALEYERMALAVEKRASIVKADAESDNDDPSSSSSTPTSH